MEKLKISDNGRYFVTESGKPLVWLADTDWTMPQRMKWDDVDYFMQTRKAQGFTALQICALDPERDVEMRNPAGEKALIDDDPLKPNENYFRYLDYILDKAEENGLYVLLLPVWGQLVVGEDWSGGTYAKTINETNAYAYAEWLGNRYKDRTNILWCLGGDRQPIHKQKDDYRPVWRLMAEGLAKGLTGKDLKYNVPDPEWQKLMITYHACREMETGECSTFSYWTDEEAWISFIMLQSGHGVDISNFDLVEKEYTREKTMPVWDGEPAYEAMPTSWPITPETRFHGPAVITKRAYWSLLAGAFGYTYGHANIWCMIAEREKNFVATTDWYEGLHSPGSRAIGLIHSFILDMKAWDCRPCQGILLDQKEKGNPLHSHIQAAVEEEGNSLCVYFPAGGRERLDLSAFAPDSDKVYAWWWKPTEGEYYNDRLEKTDRPAEMTVTDGILAVETPDTLPEHDWMLILRREDRGLPIAMRTFGAEAGQEEIRKVFEW